jgi:hypothetical protein
MSMRESLVQAMHLPPDSDTVHWLQESGLAIANADTMSQAIHDVYCGVTADHNHPNDKDRAQAHAMIAALQKAAAAESPA